MEILEDKILAQYIFRKYSNNPKNWNFIISTNTINDGFFDATITSPDEAWQLKIDSIYKPIPIITGTKIDIDFTKTQKSLEQDAVPFGYRKIDPPMLMDFFKKITQEQEMISKKNTNYLNKELNSFLGSLEPTVPVRGTDYLYGPFLFTNKSILEKNSYYKDISEKLTTNLKKKIKDRYPGYG